MFHVSYFPVVGKQRMHLGIMSELTQTPEKEKKLKCTYQAHSRAVIMKTFQTEASLQKRKNQHCKVRRIDY